jgi:heme-degrading monooxygenase HmoA
MIVTIFRSRLRPENMDEYQVVAERVHALAETMPGFVSIRSYKAEDGERVSIVTFDSMETHEAWRSHPEHMEAQRLGREKFYSWYAIEVCTLVRGHEFNYSRSDTTTMPAEKTPG